MSLYSPLRKRVERDCIVRVFKNLMGIGKINVALGQEVTPSDIIGSGSISAGFRVINLATQLSIPPNQVEKYLTKSMGQTIYKDELLAQKKGFLGNQKVITAPADGVLDYLNPKSGELRMTFLPKKADLPAGVYGIVEGIDNQKGQIVIKIQATLIHGVFGSGRPRDGELHILSKRDELLGPSHISPEHSGRILVTGSLIFKEAISQAISSGVSGIISGGMNSKDYKSMAGGRLIFPKKLDNDIGISIVVCEGFGSIPIGEDIYSVLEGHNGKYVSIDGNKGIVYLPSFESKSMSRVRSTALKPLTAAAINYDSEGVITDLNLGMMVRVIGNTYPGLQGKVIAIDKTETLLPSGIKTYLVTVESKRRKIQVPVANLEVIL